jgi:cytochrome c peroxidase
MRSYAAFTSIGLALAACSSPPSVDAGHDATLEAGPDAVTDANPTCTVDAHATYPDAPYGFEIGSVLPDLHFTDASGHDVALHDFYTPCVAPAPVLIVRTFAAWSSFSRQAASHTARYRMHANATRMRLLDVLVLSQDNVPARADDLSAWQTRYDVAPDRLVVDPAYQIQPSTYGLPELPTVLVIDTSTMRVLDAITPLLLVSNPLEYYLDWDFAQLDGRSTPMATPPMRIDGRFTADLWELVQAMRLPDAPPPDPTDAHADDVAAAQLGTMLFADASLSPTNTVSCATCHSPTQHFVDGRPTGVGVAVGDRNTPSVALSAHNRWQFWDGRADTLWSQAIGPIENPREMASSRLFVAHVVADHYASAYAAVFGPLPALADTTRFPAAGRPGDAAYDNMTSADQDAVTRVYVNIGKAIEAYERMIRPTPIALDRYIAGNYDALTPQARDGLLDFVSFGCVQCHYGPRLTDDSFHNIGMPTGRQDGQPDRGRIDAIAQIMASPFRADGTYSDAPGDNAHLQHLAVDPMMLGQFHTPALRGVAVTGPWGHGGTFTRLEDVVTHYGSPTARGTLSGTTGMLDRHLPLFDTVTPMYVDAIAAFLRTLDAP